MSIWVSEFVICRIESVHLQYRTWEGATVVLYCGRETYSTSFQLLKYFSLWPVLIHTCHYFLQLSQVLSFFALKMPFLFCEENFRWWWLEGFRFKQEVSSTKDSFVCHLKMYHYPSACKCKRNEQEFIQFFSDLPALLLEADVPHSLYTLLLYAYQC